MSRNSENTDKYKTIGEVAKDLDLVDKKTGNLQTHTLRYWETQFAQLRPRIRAGKRRYYSKKDFEIIKFIKYLLKEKGMTINGVRKILNSDGKHHIDQSDIFSVYKPALKNSLIMKKIKNISKIIKELKKIK